jgi:signal peptidase I
LGGFGKVKNDDVVVFNFPEGDSVATNQQDRSYYEMVRSYGRERVQTDKRTFGDVIYRPVDKRENYIKRCIAIPGDSLKLVNGLAYVNNKPQKDIPGIQYKYLVTIQGNSLNSNAMEKLGIGPEDIEGSGSKMIISLTSEQVAKMDGMKFILSKERITWPKEDRDPNIFPSSDQYSWSLDNFGPIWVPKKGTTIRLTPGNLPIYRRIIDVYEENDLRVSNGDIYINGAVAKEYTFKMDYYWMMGDNRYNSADSRFWGFVPEDHIVGKASFVWLSLDKNKSFLAKIRWSRFFMGVK